MVDRETWMRMTPRQMLAQVRADSAALLDVYARHVVVVVALADLERLDAQVTEPADPAAP